MNQRTLSSTLSSDFGAPTQVVKMSPGGRSPYGSYPVAEIEEGNWVPDPQQRFDPTGKARETNENMAKVSVAETFRGAVHKDQRRYNDWQRQQKAAQEAAHGEQTLTDQAVGLVAGEEAEAVVRGPQGADHYQYLQYPDNGVRVIKNTKTKTDLDVYYAPGSTAAQNVIATYGPHPASVAGAPQQEESIADKVGKAFEVFQPSAASLPPGQTTEEKKDNTLLYVGLGVGGVVALGLLIMAVKRKD